MKKALLTILSLTLLLPHRNFAMQNKQKNIGQLAVGCGIEKPKQDCPECSKQLPRDALETYTKYLSCCQYYYALTTGKNPEITDLDLLSKDELKELNKKMHNDKQFEALLKKMLCIEKIILVSIAIALPILLHMALHS